MHDYELMIAIEQQAVAWSLSRATLIRRILSTGSLQLPCSPKVLPMR